jgi:uncharacterized protein YndB with AHSA1/START domain
MAEFVSLSRFDAPEAPWAVARREIIAAGPERVWRALVEPAELVRWWCDRAAVEARPGGRYAFGGPHVFGTGAGETTALAAAAGAGAPGDFEILEIEPEERLEFRWRLFGAETRVAYELVNTIEQTELSVTQTAEAPLDWKSGPDDPNWWWVALPALRSLVEQGRADLRLDYAALGSATGLELSVDVTTFPWVIWDKLTNPKELDRWWARKAGVDLRPGGDFILGRDGEGPRRVLEVAPGERLLLEWEWEGGARGAIEWTIAETETATRLTLRDPGPWDPGLRRDALAIGHASTLLHLKQMSERGITPREYQAT